MPQDSPTPVQGTRWIPAGTAARGVTAVVLLVVMVLGGVFALGGQKVQLDGARPVLVDVDAPVVPETDSAQAAESADGVLEPGTDPDDVALTIGGVDVTASQVVQRVGVLRGLYGVEVPTDPEQVDTFRREVAKTVAVTTVLQQQAEARDVTAPPDQVEAQLDNIVQSGFGGDQEAFVGQLEQEGLSEDDVRREIGDQLLGLALFEQVTADVEGPSDPRIQTFYDSNRADLVTQPRRVVSVILQPGEGRANQVLARLRTGADFGQVAKEVSTDEATKAQGGDLGAVTRDQLPTQVADVAFRTTPGVIFGPLEVEGGWVLGLVRSAVPARSLSLDEASDQIRSALLDRSRQATWGRFLTRSVAEADITYADAYLPSDPDNIDLTAPSSAGSGSTEGGTP